MHLVFERALSPSVLETSSWAQWKKTNADVVHLEVARRALSRDAQQAGRPSSLRLSLANLSTKVPHPKRSLVCDLLVLFIPVEN